MTRQYITKFLVLKKALTETKLLEKYQSLVIIKQQLYVVRLYLSCTYIGHKEYCVSFRDLRFVNM